MSERSLIPAQDELKAIEIMAKHAVDSKYFEKLGGFAGVFSIAMYARELNIPVMSALFGGMSNILGKIQIAPQLMNAMIRKAGHTLKIDSNDTRCVITGTRKDTGEQCTVSFSIEDARKAGIFKSGGGWDKYPSDMCFARALSRLARRLFPDVIGMAYVDGEIQDDKQNGKHSSMHLEDADAEIKIFTDDEIFAQLYTKIGYMEVHDGQLKDYIKSCVAAQTRFNFMQYVEKALEDTPAFEKYFRSYLDKELAKKIALEQKPPKEVETEAYVM